MLNVPNATVPSSSSCFGCAIGLVSIALYFANSMTYELRASDNRASGLAADQAIEGAARYVGYVLATVRHQRRGAGHQPVCLRRRAGRRRAFLAHRPRPVRHDLPPSRISAWLTKAPN